MNKVLRCGAWAAGVALAAVCTATPAAQGAPPTRIIDHTRDVVCTGTNDGIRATVRAGLSELAGSSSFVALSDATTGDFVGYGSATSDWTDGTVRAAVPVTDRDDQPAGEVYFAAAYTPTGSPQTVSDTFNDGNIHVAEKHTTTAYAISSAILSYRGSTFTDLRCDGSAVDGSLIFTNPAVHVSRSTGLMYECTTDNLSSAYIQGPMDELFVDVQYADQPDGQASGIIPTGPGSDWSGEFRLQVADEPAGNVAVSAHIGPAGRPLHATDGDTGMRNHARLTPYPFSMTIEGPGAPATLTCTLYDLRLTWMSPNPVP